MIFFRSIILLLTLTISIPAYAASLNAQLRVSSAFENSSTGSVIELEIIPPESSDAQSSAWTIETKNKGKWIEHGPLLIDFYSLAPPDERKKRLVLQAIVFKSGQNQVPPIIIRQEDGNLIAATNSITLNASSILSSEDEKSKWILPPLVMQSWNILGITAIAILVLISLIAVIVWLRKRYLAKQTVLKTPLTIFQENLNAIENDFLRLANLDNAKGKKFSFSLTNAIRTYLSAESGEKLLDLTDFELIQAINSHPRLAPTEQLVKDILEVTLKPRYSDSLLEKNIAIELLNNAKKIYLPPLTKEGKES